MDSRCFGIMFLMRTSPFVAAALDNVRTSAHDVCAHGVEEVSKVNDVRFLGSIFDYSEPFCLYSSEHSVHSSTDGNDVEEYLTACELIGCEVDHTLSEGIVSSEGRKSLEVLIYRAVAEGTSSGHRNSCLVELAEECAEEVVGRTHFPCSFIGDAAFVDMGRIYSVSILSDALHFSAHFLEDTEADVDIADRRNVLDNAGFVREDNCRKDSYGCILSTAYSDLACETSAALYNKLIQLNSLLIFQDCIYLLLNFFLLF